MLDIEALRADTEVLSNYTYLNNARISPFPKPALAAMQRLLFREFGHSWRLDQQEQVMAEARRTLGELLGAGAGEIAVTQSGSYGINVLVNGLAWEHGDNVVMTELAYRSIAQSLLRLRQEYGVEVRVAAADGLYLDPRRVLEQVDGRTRLVVVPQIPTFCGVVQPVAEIGRGLAGSRTLFAVNATQSVGQMPVNVGDLHCDALFGTSRKWLRGPRGLGFLYVREDLIPELRPSLLGYPAGIWTDPDRYEVVDTVDRLHLGDYPYILLAGLTESVRYLQAVGPAAIARHNRWLGEVCRRTLAGLPGIELYDAEQGVTGTVPFNIRGRDADETVALLAHHGVITCAIYENNVLLGMRRLGQKKLVRASLHYYNTEADIQRFGEVLETITKNSTPS